MKTFKFKKKQSISDAQKIYIFAEKSSNTDCKCTYGGTTNTACSQIKVVK